MDPLRSDTPPAEALTGPERDARIEQLLLAGLDEYFAHRYENAINLWTRVLFLDRQHDRARAYIERARRAQAERERESDAALHQAGDAFDSGDVARARALVGDALDHGASLDDAHEMLERIERLANSKVPKFQGSKVPGFQGSRVPKFQGSKAPGVAAPMAGAGNVRQTRGRSAAVLLIAAALGVLLVGVWGVAVPEPSAWAIFSGSSSTVTSTPWTPDPLPLAQASEFPLSRARALAATGRLRDALRVLDRIPMADPLRRDADLLRADVQRQLLTLALAERPPE